MNGLYIFNLNKKTMIQSSIATVTEFYPEAFQRFTRDRNVFTFYTAGECLLIITVLEDDIIRVRYILDGLVDDDFSYALNVKFEGKVDYIKVNELSELVQIVTSKIKIEVAKKNLSLTFKDLKDNIINQDEKGFHWEDNYVHGGSIVQMSKVVQIEERFFGLGDKPSKLSLRGKRVQNWGSDTYGYQKDEDPLYKNIPFYLGVHQEQGYGIFFDNTFRAYFDFASERRSVTSFWADGGEMNYYFINGPKLINVTEKYSRLTGVPELPPMWALGFHQCKWSYYPEAQVKEITNKFRKLKIPCDAIYLDIDYMDGFRCFTWDKEKFPKPTKMIAELKEKGFKMVVIIDPGIKIDPEYSVFKEGLENNYFCRRADGPYMKGKVWPGECYFPDFTNPKVRKWWSGLFDDLITENDVRGVWNDMNEPAVFEVASKTFPDDVRHDYDGHPCSHRKAHNVYGMQMSRATYRGVRKFTKQKNQRPFIITRSTYSGGQRYSSGWTGDNIATWEHLWVANIQCQRMAVSGFSFIGSDIGGFTEHPTAELFIRWIQLGVFHPFCRVHSSGDHGDQEPWTFGEIAVNMTRKFIELRYQLLPYLYSTFYQYVKNGTPILRPLAFVAQDDKETLYREDEFMHGDNILVCPVLEPNSQGRYLYLPKGQWYNYWTDEKVEGGRELWVAGGLDTIPMFIRPGAVIPMYPVQQYVGEKEINQLTLHIYHHQSEQVTNLMYEDGGDGYDYDSGVYNIKNFHTKFQDGSFKLIQDRSGHYIPTYETYELVFHGFEDNIKECMVDGIKQKIAKTKDGHYNLVVSRKFLEIII